MFWFLSVMNNWYYSFNESFLKFNADNNKKPTLKNKLGKNSNWNIIYCQIAIFNFKLKHKS